MPVCWGGGRRDCGGAPGQDDDYILRGSSMTLQAMPSFWLALIVIVVLVLVFEWIPSISYKHIWKTRCGTWEVMLLPAFIVGLRSSAEILRMTRSSVLEVLREDLCGRRIPRAAPAAGAVRPRIEERFASGGDPGRV